MDTSLPPGMAVNALPRSLLSCTEWQQALTASPAQRNLNKMALALGSTRPLKMDRSIYKNTCTSGCTPPPSVTKGSGAAKDKGVKGRKKGCERAIENFVLSRAKKWTDCQWCCWDENVQCVTMAFIWNNYLCSRLISVLRLKWPATDCTKRQPFFKVQSKLSSCGKKTAIESEIWTCSSTSTRTR